MPAPGLETANGDRQVTLTMSAESNKGRGLESNRDLGSPAGDVLAPAVDAPAPILVESDRQLSDLCRRWRRCDAVGLDTEFIRTRTFFPKLGLVQVGTPTGGYLIDVLSIGAWDPLVELIEDESVTKVLHSCSEDLEVLHHFFGTLPRPIFDTQTAATLVGRGYSLGYQRLVLGLFDVELPKGETRSNWLQRPLTDSQITYAGLDVAYLLPLYERLCDDLTALGRGGWLEEESARLEVAARSRFDPELAYQRVKKTGRLLPREKVLLRSLSEWREQEARSRDVPRGFVVPDDVLVRVVRAKPTSHRKLGEIKGISPREFKRSAEDFLDRIRTVMEIPEADLPLDRGGSSPPGRSKGRVDELRDVVQQVALEVGLAPEFLAQRRLIEDMVRSDDAGQEDPLPGELGGWRRRVIGDRLLAALEAAKRGPLR